MTSPEGSSAFEREFVREWTAVHYNFNRLLELIQQVARHDPLPNYCPKMYERRKNQLLDLMFYYTTSIISNAMTTILAVGPQNRLHEKLVEMESLRTLISQQRENNPFHFMYSAKEVGCPSLIILFLKMAVARGMVSSDPGKIQQLMTDIHEEKRFKKVHNYRYTPGILACIMVLSRPGNKNIITATYDKYNFELEKVLEEFSAVTKDTRVEKRPVEVNSQQVKDFLAKHSSSQKRVDLTAPSGSILATFKPNGKYMGSCLLDYYRFKTERPEGNRRKMNAIFGPAYCAKWFSFLELAMLGEDLPTTALPDTLPS
ncbi:hypothetical protein BU16DRAFT_545191 [Lophium mytilinum]|uniref:Uncharacterized protein n=1 Tax=Lophium mytilinum TaxID=390894 RepID=A0A6A6Q9V1_9PEZI|nr:hypothetical protein BU16DRAFT_545191 [Lophium mytilinum]